MQIFHLSKVYRRFSGHFQELATVVGNFYNDEHIQEDEEADEDE